MMFKISWDKAMVEQYIRAGGGTPDFLDFWVPIQISENGVDISGLDATQDGDVSHFLDTFLNLLFVFQSIDPEKLGGKDFCFWSNQKNRVSGGGFEFFVESAKGADKLSIRYTNRALGEYRTFVLPLRDFAEGVICSTEEMYSDLIKLAPERKDGASYRCIREGLDILREWYHNTFSI